MGRCSANCVNLQDLSKRKKKSAITVMDLKHWYEITVDGAVT